MDQPTDRKHWRAADVVRGNDLTGRRAIVTGGGSGIGLETARALAGAGATVTIASRDLPATEAAAAEINASVGADRVIAARLDLASLASVRDVAASWDDAPLDMLILNAGLMACPFSRTTEGFETQIGVNHHGHSLLARLLVPALEAAAPARIVVLSSPGHRLGDVVLDDLHYRDRPYSATEAYGQSKTADSLLALHLDVLLAPRGVRSFAVFPGGIATPLLRHMTDALYADLGVKPVSTRLSSLKTPEQGAATTVWAAVSPELDGRGGLHLEDCAIAPPEDADHPRGVRAYAASPERAAALWDVTTRDLELA